MTLEVIEATLLSGLIASACGSHVESDLRWDGRAQSELLTRLWRIGSPESRGHVGLVVFKATLAALPTSDEWRVVG